jgi:pterin-4a-carbinolamine dehydratase
MKNHKNKKITLSITGIILIVTVLIISLLFNSKTQTKQTRETSLTQAYGSLQEQTMKETIPAPVLTVTKDQTNPLLVHLSVQDSQTTITKLKVAKVAHVEDQVDFTVQGTEIPITPSQSIQTTYTVTEEGLYFFYAENEAGSSATRKIVLTKTFPITAKATVNENNPYQIHLEVANTILDIVTIKIALTSEVTSDTYFETQGTAIPFTRAKNVITDYTVGAQGIYTIFIQDEIKNTQTLQVRAVEPDSISIQATQNPDKLNELTVKVTDVSANIVMMKTAEGEDLDINYFKENGSVVSINPAREITKMFTIEHNCTFNIYVKDELGSSHLYAIVINNLSEQTDTTPPILVVGYSTFENTNQDVQVTITANEKIQPVQGWTLSSNQMTLTKTYSENTTEQVTVLDLAGNRTMQTINVTNIDRKAPNLTVSYSTTETTTEPVKVTITADEEIQEVNGWDLSLDQMSLTKTYGQNVEETITIKDLAGNIATQKIVVRNIEVSENLVTQVHYSQTQLTNQDVQVTITANLPLKPLAGWTLSSTKQELSKRYSQNTQEQIKVESVSGKSVDEQILIQNIDKTPPTVEVNYDKTNPTKENVIVTIQANEEIQGISGWNLTQNKKVLTKTYPQNIEETVTIKDLAGNSITQKITIQNIDKIAPIVQVKFSETQPTKQNVVVTIKANEKIQKIDGWGLSQDELTLTKMYFQNMEETIQISDLVGNITTQKIEISNILPNEPSDYYPITEDGYITQIVPETTVEEFIQNLGVEASLSIPTGKIKTGMTATFAGKTYTLVVTGDLNGDGKFDLQDLSNIILHLAQYEQYRLKGAFLRAGDINQDGQTDMIDLSTICLRLAQN